MAQTAFTLLVIGDEILSGKRQDKHLPRVIGLLAARGLELGQARFIGDDLAAIADAVRAAHEAGQVLLSCGGIGATPDDLTRQAAAQAFGVPVERHAQAEALIVREYGADSRPKRVLMADLPRGAALIPNPVNRVPGFSVANCHFVPGFPEMAWPMLKWVLDTHYRALHRGEPDVEYRLRVVGTVAESDFLDLMQATLDAHPGLRFSSLPCRGDAQRTRHIEFGFRGPREVARAAYLSFVTELPAGNFTVEALAAP